VQDFFVTRDKPVTMEARQTTESPLADLSQKWQAGIAATFATGLCHIALDADQNELGRQMLSSGGMGRIGKENMVMVRLKHGPYHHDGNHRQSTNSIPTTYAFSIHCPVTYARKVGTNDVVTVAGSFTDSAIDSPADGVVIQDVSCNFTGRES
jgi:hypothetical protein